MLENGRPTPELLLLLLANLLSFLMMGWDKAQARRGKERVPERTLLLFALPGGGIGAWIAVFFFRHKSSKPAFKLPLAVVTAIGLGGWVWWLSR